MIFLTKFFSDQYRRRFLFLKLGGPTQKWGLLLVPKSPTLEKHWKSLKNRVFVVIFFCAHAAPCRCWKSYLPYSKRSENIINRKNRKFYIEAIPKKKSQLRKKRYFFSSSKKFRKIFDQKKIDKLSAKIWQKISNLKSTYVWDLRLEILCQIFADHFSIFFGRKNFDFFLNSKKIYFFRSWEKNLGIASK